MEATTQVTERTWTNVGIDYNSTPELKVKLAGMFDRLEWLDVSEGITMGMMPGEGIKAAIEELKIPKVSHVATSNEMAPYGLYGIRGHFSNGRADVYLCDEGSSLVVLASDFYPN